MRRLWKQMLIQFIVLSLSILSSHASDPFRAHRYWQNTSATMMNHTWQLHFPQTNLDETFKILVSSGASTSSLNMINTGGLPGNLVSSTNPLTDLVTLKSFVQGTAPDLGWAVTNILTLINSPDLPGSPIVMPNDIYTNIQAVQSVIGPGTNLGAILSTLNGLIYSVGGSTNLTTNALSVLTLLGEGGGVLDIYGKVINLENSLMGAAATGNFTTDIANLGTLINQPGASIYDKIVSLNTALSTALGSEHLASILSLINTTGHPLSRASSGAIVADISTMMQDIHPTAMTLGDAVGATLALINSPALPGAPVTSNNIIDDLRKALSVIGPGDTIGTCLMSLNTSLRTIDGSTNLTDNVTSMLTLLGTGGGSLDLYGKLFYLENMLIRAVGATTATEDLLEIAAILGAGGGGSDVYGKVFYIENTLIRAIGATNMTDDITSILNLLGASSGARDVYGKLTQTETALMGAAATGDMTTNINNLNALMLSQPGVSIYDKIVSLNTALMATLDGGGSEVILTLINARGLPLSPFSTGIIVNDVTLAKNAIQTSALTVGEAVSDALMLIGATALSGSPASTNTIFGDLSLLQSAICNEANLGSGIRTINTSLRAIGGANDLATNMASLNTLIGTGGGAIDLYGKLLYLDHHLTGVSPTGNLTTDIMTQNASLAAMGGPSSGILALINAAGLPGFLVSSNIILNDLIATKTNIQRSSLTLGGAIYNIVSMINASGLPGSPETTSHIDGDLALLQTALGRGANIGATVSTISGLVNLGGLPDSPISSNILMMDLTIFKDYIHGGSLNLSRAVTAVLNLINAPALPSLPNSTNHVHEDLLLTLGVIGTGTSIGAGLNSVDALIRSPGSAHVLNTDITAVNTLLGNGAATHNGAAVPDAYTKTANMLARFNEAFSTSGKQFDLANAIGNIPVGTTFTSFEALLHSLGI